MKQALLLLAASLFSSGLAASPVDGFPWPPSWQRWQATICDAAGQPIQATGVAMMKNGRIAVGLDRGVAVLSAEGEVLRQVTTEAGEIIAIACAGDDLILGASRTLLVLDGTTLTNKATIPVGGRIYQIASNHDGSSVAVARYGTNGVVVNLADQAVKEIPLSGYASGVAWLPAGQGVVFASGQAIEVFDVHGERKQVLSSSKPGFRMDSPKLTASEDGKWIAAIAEGGGMMFWSTTWPAAEPIAAFSSGGPWFAAFFAHSPTKPYVGRALGQLPEAEIPVIDPNPYPASEVTGIVGRPDGIVVFSTWRGDIVCWDLEKAPTSTTLAKAVQRNGDDRILLRFGRGQAWFSPIVGKSDDQDAKRIVLRFEWRGEVLAEYSIPGMVRRSSPLTAIGSSDGRTVLVSTGTPPIKMLLTMEQIRETPALAQINANSMFETQPSLYVVDGVTGKVSPLEETRGISAYFPGRNRDVAAFAIYASSWSGLATLDMNTKMLLRTGRTDLSTESPPRVFPMAADRLAVISKGSRRLHWMQHDPKEDPKSVALALQSKFPFRPNGSWRTIATADLAYDAWSAAPSPDGRYLAVLTDCDTIDLLTWGEPSPKGCLAAERTSRNGSVLSWQDDSTLVCEGDGISTTFRIPDDLLVPVGSAQEGGRSGAASEGKILLAQAPQGGRTLVADGLNHIITKEGRRRVVWLPSISPGIWCEVPERNLVVHWRQGLWVSDIATGKIVHGYDAPFANGVAATPSTIYTRTQTGAVLEWKLP